MPVLSKARQAVIAKELALIPNEKVKTITAENLIKIHNGARDFRF